MSLCLYFDQRLSLCLQCCSLSYYIWQVDLLGDEVDALTALLEKVYTVLEHYAPVLRHYPGVSLSFALRTATVTGSIAVSKNII